MPQPKDHDDEPGRALVRALVAMVAVALLVGVTVGFALMAAARISGFSDSGTASSDAQADDPASLYMPSYEPTEDAGSGWDLPRPEKSPSSLGSSDSAPSSNRRSKPITLFAAPQQVAPGERINFNGVYNGGEGATLQVQRREGGSWNDFPVTASVRGGSFETWIITSKSGPSRFRMYDESADRTSNVVKVKIG